MRNTLNRLVAVALAGLLIAACEDADHEPADPAGPDVTVSIAKIVADQHQTSVKIQFGGDIPPGTRIGLGTGRPELTDTAGATHYAERAQPIDQLSQVWVFPAIPAQGGELVLEVPALQWGPVPQAGDSSPPDIRAMPGPWTVKYEWDGKRVDSTSYALDLDPLPYGPGELVVESVTVSEAGVVVDGYIIGFTMEEVPELQMYPPSLVLPSGASLAILAGGNGWGENRERWSFRFAPAASVDGATLTIPFTVTNHPHDMAAAESLRKRGGPSASVLLDTE